MFSAFQPNAFQSNAVQAAGAVTSVACDPPPDGNHILHTTGGCAIGVDGTGVYLDWGPTASASSVGGSYNAPRKVVIRKGKRLLAFKSYTEAIAALEDGQAIEASTDAEKSPVEAPTPVQTVEVREVRRLAQRFDHAAEYQRLIDTAQYTELLVLYERLRAVQQDEEDVELLLLA